MVYDPLIPYNDLPDLPPRQDIETVTVLKKAVAAGRALAELKGLGETLPDQSILVNSIILQEARVSSEIENIITTNDALFRAISSSSQVGVDPATKEVLRYREALWTGFKDLKERPILSTNVFVHIVNTIRENQAGIRQLPGTVIANSTTKETIYTPPDGEDVIRRKLHNLEEYIHSTEGPDSLIKMAVAHYQFEAIHPFSDGNGRTGRIIGILYLVKEALLDLPVLYLSRYIVQNKGEYYHLLRQVTESQEWQPWILYMIEAVEETAGFTRKRILDIRELVSRTIEIVHGELPKIYSKELVELLFKQPYTKVEFLVDAGIAKRQTAATYLRELESIGVLRSSKVGRENIFLNVGLYDLLSG